MNKKLLVLLSMLLLSTPSFSFAAYEEVDCSTNPVFEENSCSGTDQCFIGGNKLQGDNIGLLSDQWVNATDVTKVYYDEERIDPEMINLDPYNVVWNQTPSTEGFWEYTDEFNELYDEDFGGYVLEPGKSVNWLQSSLSHAYNLEKNTAPEGSNIGMLVYSIVTHELLNDGDITEGGEPHRECVLFQSGEAASEDVEEPTKLPETGPANFVLMLVLAMFLSLGVMKFKTRS